MISLPVFQLIWLLLSLIPLIVISRHMNQSRTNFAFTLFVFSGFIWALSQVSINYTLIYTSSEVLLRCGIFLNYIGVISMTLTMIYLSWCYSGQWQLYRNKKIIGCLLGVGLFFLLIILTNDIHHLFYKTLTTSNREYNILFYTFMALSCPSIFYAYFTMRRIHSSHGCLSQLLLALCYLIVIAGYGWNIFTHNPAADFLPAAYFFHLLCSLFFIHHQCPFSLAPLSAEQIINSMATPLEITSRDFCYQNNEARRLDMSFMRPDAAGHIHYANHIYTEEICHLNSGETLRMLTDITDLHSAYKTIQTQNALLQQLNIQLNSDNMELDALTETISILAAQEQRLLISRTLNEEIQHSLEELSASLKSHIERPTHDDISRDIQLTVDTLETIRDLVSHLRQEMSQ